VPIKNVGILEKSFIEQLQEQTIEPQKHVKLVVAPIKPGTLGIKKPKSDEHAKVKANKNVRLQKKARHVREVAIKPSTEVGNQIQEIPKFEKAVETTVYSDKKITVINKAEKVAEPTTLPLALVKLEQETSGLFNFVISVDEPDVITMDAPELIIETDNDNEDGRSINDVFDPYKQTENLFEDEFLTDVFTANHETHTELAFETLIIERITPQNIITETTLGEALMDKLALANPEVVQVAVQIMQKISHAVERLSQISSVITESSETERQAIEEYLEILIPELFMQLNFDSNPQIIEEFAAEILKIKPKRNKYEQGTHELKVSGLGLSSIQSYVRFGARHVSAIMLGQKALYYSYA
jgi:hypothetical protein